VQELFFIKPEQVHDPEIISILFLRRFPGFEKPADSPVNNQGAGVFASPLIFYGAEAGDRILHQESL
jgi:hypothetical protein